MNNFIKNHDYLINEEIIKTIIIISRYLVNYVDYSSTEDENYLIQFIEHYEDNEQAFELEDSLTTNACQPSYDKIIDLEKTVLALSRIATEYSENFVEDYQTLSNFINKKE